MKPRIVFVLLTAVLLAACGLNDVGVTIDAATTASPADPQVVTVIVVATPTPESAKAKAATAPQQGSADEPVAIEPPGNDEKAAVETAVTGELPPSLLTGSWQSIPDLPRYINDLVADPQNSQRLFAATGSAGSGSGVYKSEDGGLTWHLAADGLPGEDVVALALSSTQPPILYALVGVRGDVYASADSAQSWTHLGNSGLFGGFEHWMQVDPADNSVIYALEKSSELRRSSDGGHTWLPFGQGLPADEHSVFALSLAIDPTNPDILYAGTGGFVGGGHGVYKSTDGGQTWTAVNQGMLDYRISALAIDSDNPQTVYAGADDGQLFKTTDGGQTWVNLSDKLLLPYNSSPAVEKILLTSNKTIFLLCNVAGVLVSQDGGQKWEALGNPGQSGSEFSVMAIVSAAEPTLVVGTRREGSWRYHTN